MQKRTVCAVLRCRWFFNKTTIAKKKMDVLKGEEAKRVAFSLGMGGQDADNYLKIIDRHRRIA